MSAKKAPRSSVGAISFLKNCFFSEKWNKKEGNELYFLKSDRNKINQPKSNPGITKQGFTYKLDTFFEIKE